MVSSGKKIKKCIECEGDVEITPLVENGIHFEGYKCQKCGHTIVTLDQMQRYEKARDLKKALPTKRKIVKIGNSLGFTLPSNLSKYGLEIGRKLEIRVIDESNIQITFL
ncbi:MAG: hypothetical protein HY776_06990 [Actinobacteria bacterium]|nr:hypothetical protein [Actinomycetota bacterium]